MWLCVCIEEHPNHQPNCDQADNRQYWPEWDCFASRTCYIDRTGVLGTDFQSIASSCDDEGVAQIKSRWRCYQLMAERIQLLWQPRIVLRALNKAMSKKQYGHCCSNDIKSLSCAPKAVRSICDPPTVEWDRILELLIRSLTRVRSTRCWCWVDPRRRGGVCFCIANSCQSIHNLYCENIGPRGRDDNCWRKNYLLPVTVVHRYQK